MSRLSKMVRKYVKCPQLDAGIEYGKWGALRLDQREQIAKLCEEVDVFEDAADKFGKEIQSLKQQLAEKKEKIGILKKAFDEMWADLMNYVREYQENSTNGYIIVCCKDILSEMWHTRLNRDLYIEQVKEELKGE